MDFNTSLSLIIFKINIENLKEDFASICWCLNESKSVLESDDKLIEETPLINYDPDDIELDDKFKHLKKQIEINFFITLISYFEFYLGFVVKETIRIIFKSDSELAEKLIPFKFINERYNFLKEALKINHDNFIELYSKSKKYTELRNELIHKKTRLENKELISEFIDNTGYIDKSKIQLSELIFTISDLTKNIDNIIVDNFPEIISK